jgi:hypothetical protein
LCCAAVRGGRHHAAMNANRLRLVTDDARVPKPPDRGPVERLRQRLQAERSDGVDFTSAWARATSDVLDLEWRRALRDTQEAWRAAYEGEAPTSHQRAVWALLDDEREPLAA